MTYVIKERNHVDVNMSVYSSLLKLKISSEEYKKSLRDSSRATTLWLQYLYYIDVVRLFNRAERIGNWIYI